jgi:hypothetical protein
VNEDRALIDWDRIERFIGYGPADAPVIFLGMEEGGDNDQLLPDLMGRSHSDQFEEIGHRKTTQRTWRVMCDLMLRREGVKTPTVQKRLAYQQDRLGKRSGDTLVAELMPYPSRSADDWPKIYEQRFATRRHYLRGLAPKRCNLLRDLLRSTPRELIVCYGKAHWDHYRAIFDHPSNPGPASHIEIGEWESARVVLAPHFCSRAFNSEAQLASFAQVALA